MTHYGTRLENSKRGKSVVSCLEAAWKQVRRESEGPEKVKGRKPKGKGRVILLMVSFGYHVHILSQSYITHSESRTSFARVWRENDLSQAE